MVVFVFYFIADRGKAAKMQKLNIKMENDKSKFKNE